MDEKSLEFLTEIIWFGSGENTKAALAASSSVLHWGKKRDFKSQLIVQRIQQHKMYKTKFLNSIKIFHLKLHHTFSHLNHSNQSLKNVEGKSFAQNLHMISCFSNCTMKCWEQ